MITAAIDIGSSKIAVAVGETTESGKLDVMGLGLAPSKGVHRGTVVDLKQAAEAVGQAIANTEERLEGKIESAYVGISGVHTTSTNSSGSVSVLGKDHIIGDDDILHALDEASAISIQQNQIVIHAAPRSYTVDGQSGIQDPLGMFGYRLEVEAYVVVGSSSNFNNVQQCVQKNGVDLDGQIIAPMASGYGVLTEEERQIGSAVVDIGEGTVDIGIFLNNGLWYTTSLDLAGEFLTRDLATILKIPREEANHLKEKFGNVRVDDVADEIVRVRGFGAGREVPVSKKLMAEILRARAMEILEYIWREIKRSGYDELLTAGVVFTGGTSSLAGFLELAKDVFPHDMPLRIGEPRDVMGTAALQIHAPAFATVAGLLRWSQESVPGRYTTAERGEGIPFLEKLKGWLSAFLPE